MKRIPFRLMPASWGLKGESYEEAEANYNLTGEDLERRLIEIQNKKDHITRAKQLNDLDLRYHRIDSYEHETKLNSLDCIGDLEKQILLQIDIDKKHGILSEYDADLKKIDRKYNNVIETDETKLERDLLLLDIEYKHNRIEKNVYEKRKATLKNEPWVGFVDTGFDSDKGLDGFRLELDYNKQWIEYLRLHGFVGTSDEQVLEDWFMEVCRSNIMATEHIIIQ